MSDHSNARKGYVVLVDDHKLIVRIRRAACDRCENGKGCGAGLFNRLLKPDYFDLPIARAKVPDRLARTGAQISVAIDDSLLLHAVMRIYGLTALAFVISSLCCHFLLQGLLSSALLDLFVLIVGLASAIVTSWLCSKSWNPLYLDKAISCQQVSCEPNRQTIKVTLERL
jgi:positive regulator of sigma E activity